MSRNSKDIPAFPVPQIRHAPGMQLRDYFAAEALAALITRLPSEFAVELFATAAYRHADAMMEARKR